MVFIIYQLKDILWAYLHPEYCQIQNLMLLQFVVYTVRSELRLLISEIYPARKKNKYMNINQIRMDLPVINIEKYLITNILLETFYLLPRILCKKLSFRTSFPRPFFVNHQITGKQLNWLFITKYSNFVT